MPCSPASVGMSQQMLQPVSPVSPVPCTVPASLTCLAVPQALAWLLLLPSLIGTISWHQAVPYEPETFGLRGLTALKRKSNITRGLDVIDISMLIINPAYLFNVSGQKKKLSVCPEGNVRPSGGLLDKEPRAGAGPGRPCQGAGQRPLCRRGLPFAPASSLYSSCTQLCSS